MDQPGLSHMGARGACGREGREERKADRQADRSVPAPLSPSAAAQSPLLPSPLVLL